MIYFYVPIGAPDLVESARKTAGANPVFVHGTGRILVRPDHTRTGALFVVAHGGFQRGSVIGGMIGGVMRTLTAPQLAEQISMDDLPSDWGDLRLIVCWGGYVGGPVKDWNVAGVGIGTLQREAGTAPFAGQLCSALRSEGYNRMIVTGYRGAVNADRNVVFSDGKGGATDRQEPDGDPLMRAFFDPAQFTTGERALHGASIRTFKLDTASRTVWY